MTPAHRRNVDYFADRMKDSALHVGSGNTEWSVRPQQSRNLFAATRVEVNLDRLRALAPAAFVAFGCAFALWLLAGVLAALRAAS